MSEYSDFSLYWALSIVAGLGLYFPIEQETARRAPPVTEAPGRCCGSRCGLPLGVTAVLVGLVALMLIPALRAFAPPEVVLALMLTFVAYAVAFPLRGLLSGPTAAGCTRRR